MLGRLAGAVIHDLNNLLTVIQLNAGLIEIGGLRESEVIDAAEKIDAASSRAAELTRKVLNFARGKADETGEVNLHDLVVDLSRLLEPLIARRVSLEIQPPERPRWVRGNRGAIEQAIMNLVLNASDAMESGGCVRVSFPVRDAVSGGAGVGVAVADQGTGISADARGRVFEPFFSTKSHGTGMGLAIVDRIARSHGGAVDFESEPGRGTVFRLWLPEIVSQGGGKSADATAPATPLAGRTVLVVEDDPGILALTRYLLEADGLRVLSAETGEEALEIWRRSHASIALLFTDIVLPGEMSGRELALKILSERPGLPVLYTSGYSSPGSDQSYLTADNFLSKPFQAGAMRNAVRGALSKVQSP